MILIILVLVLLIKYGIERYIRLYILFQPPINFKPHPDNITIDGINTLYFNQFPNRPVIFFCHGNACVIHQCTHMIEFAKEHRLNLFMFDYRGYGLSTKILPSSDSILKDGEKMFNHLNRKDVIVWGTSLGGAVATHVASLNKCKGVILMSTFSSIDDVVQRSYGTLVSWLVGSCMNTLRSCDKISEITDKIVIVHSKEDDVIPYESGRDLYKKISHSNSLMIATTGDHCNPNLTDIDIQRIWKFLEI